MQTLLWVGFLFSHCLVKYSSSALFSEQDPTSLGTTKGDTLFLEGSKLGFPVSMVEVEEDDNEDEDEDNEEEFDDELGDERMQEG